MIEFFLGCLVGFLIRLIMVKDMLHRRKLFDKDGKIIDLGAEMPLNDPG